MVTLASAIWQYVKHRPVDWWGMAMLGVFVAVLWIVLLKWQGRREPITKTDQSPEQLPHKAELERCKSDLYESAKSNLEYREERDRSDEERRRLQEQLEVFTPLQLDAFRLAKDLINFLHDMGNRPEGRPQSAFPNTREGLEDFLNERTAIPRPWLEKLRHRYAKNYAARVKKMVHEFGEQNLDVSNLGNFESQVDSEMEVVTVRKELVRLSHDMDLIYIIDPEAKK